jgi:hypothetical protein
MYYVTFTLSAMEVPHAHLYGALHLMLYNKSIPDLIMVLYLDNVQLLSLIHQIVLHVPVAQSKRQKSSDILSKLQMSCRVL